MPLVFNLYIAKTHPWHNIWGFFAQLLSSGKKSCYYTQTGDVHLPLRALAVN